MTLVFGQTMNPPFRLDKSPIAAAVGLTHAGQIASADVGAQVDGSDDRPSNGRARLAQLNTNLLFSVIGTCLSTLELRKLMARFINVVGASDLDVHHEAVRLAAQGGAETKALNKALDRRHEASVQHFARVRDPVALGALWEESCKKVEIPGAYWAVLTHRDATHELRQKVFGEVHMLSHLVGAANRADLRRLVALETENAELRERLDQQVLRSQDLVSERDRMIERLQQELDGLHRVESSVIPPQTGSRLSWPTFCGPEDAERPDAAGPSNPPTALARIPTTERSRLMRTMARKR